MRTLRIATYNVHKCRGLDGRTRVERIARVLEKIDADIIALQEVVSHAGLSIEQHQADYLAQRLGRFYALGETRKHRGGIYGNVTLSRWDFERVQPIDLSVSGRERRGALRTDILVHRQLLHIFNVHLGTALKERSKQAVRLMDSDLLRAVDIAGPRVLLGDFNDWSHGLVTRTLHAEFHFNDLAVSLPKRRNYPAVLPLFHLDHIYYDHDFKLRRGGFTRDRLSLVASDHLPLIAELDLAP